MSGPCRARAAGPSVGSAQSPLFLRAGLGPSAEWGRLTHVDGAVPHIESQRRRPQPRLGNAVTATARGRVDAGAWPHLLRPVCGGAVPFRPPSKPAPLGWSVPGTEGAQPAGLTQQAPGTPWAVTLKCPEKGAARRSLLVGAGRAAGRPRMKGPHGSHRRGQGVVPGGPSEARRRAESRRGSDPPVLPTLHALAHVGSSSITRGTDAHPLFLPGDLDWAPGCTDPARGAGGRSRGRGHGDPALGGSEQTPQGWGCLTPHEDEHRGVAPECPTSLCPAEPAVTSSCTQRPQARCARGSGTSSSWSPTWQSLLIVLAELMHGGLSCSAHTSCSQVQGGVT